MKFRINIIYTKLLHLYQNNKEIQDDWVVEINGRMFIMWNHKYQYNQYCDTHSVYVGGNYAL